MALLPATDVDGDRIRGAVEEVLSRPAFQQPEPGPIERARREVLEALADLAGRILTGGAADLVGWAIAGSAALLLVVLAVRLLRGTTGTPRSASDGDGVHHVPDPAGWRRRAEEHARAGRLRDACRCRYRALVAELEQRGILADRPGQTVGEETARLRAARPAVAVPFSGAAEVFRAAWYGPDEPSEQDLRRLTGLCDRVLEVAG